MFCRPVVVLLSFASALCAHGQIINVPADQPTIQQAIDAATGGEEIVLAPGSYLEHIDTLGKAITIRSTDPSSAAVVAATIIDGGNDPDLPGFPQNPGTVIAIRSGEGNDTSILGLTITGGASAGTTPLTAGGGLGVFQSSPTIADCRFIDNTVAVNYFGGAVYAHTAGLVFLRCDFVGNSSGGGAGCWLDGCTAEFVECTFSANTTPNFGAAVGTQFSQDVSFSGCTFENNSADNFDGGALSLGMLGGASAEIVGCEFRGNSARDGGALRVGDAGVLLLDGCLFENNSASRNGGGVLATSVDAVFVEDCVFENNDALRDGGGMVSNFSDTAVTLSVFADNACGGDGGGLNIAFGGPTSISSVEGCRFEGNSAVVTGGGLQVFNGDVTIRYSDFLTNSAESGGGLNIGGSASAHQLISCAFTTNSAFSGGGISASSSQFLIDSCVFSSNMAVGGLGANAGGLSLAVPRSSTLTSLVFCNNSSEGRGGALEMSNAIDPVVVDACEFTSNQSATDGGAIVSVGNEDASVVRSLFDGNTAGARGGAVFESSATTGPVTYVNNQFFSNSASGEGGAIFDVFSFNTVYANNVFAANNAPSGGALALWCSAAEIVGCTFVDSAADVGGAFWLSCPSPGNLVTVAGSIVRGSSAGSGPVAFVGPNMDMDISESNIEGDQSSIAVWPGQGLGFAASNIDADPHFADSAGADGNPATPTDNDYRLLASSPCIDAGNNVLLPMDVADLDSDTDVSESVPIDLAGYPRFVDDPLTADTGVGSGPLADMGAFEFQANACPGDVNGDGATDAADLSVIIGAFGIAVTPGTGGDVNGDGVVDAADLSVVIGGFGCAG